MGNQFKLRIAPDGEVTAIYDDILAGLLKEGAARIERASFVEPPPTGDGWLATMSDGTVLGPFSLRKEALEAEVGYLEEKMF